MLNLTATQPTAGGFITAYAGGQPVPGTSNLNFTAGKTVANQVIVPLTGDVADFYNDSGGTVQLVADLDGYFSSSATSSFVPYGPTRIVDTRVGLGAKAGAVPAHGTLVITPSTFNTGCNPNATCTTAPSAFVLNVTVTQPKAGGVADCVPGQRFSSGYLQRQFLGRPDSREPGNDGAFQQRYRHLQPEQRIGPDRR